MGLPALGGVDTRQPHPILHVANQQREGVAVRDADDLPLQLLGLNGPAEEEEDDDDDGKFRHRAHYISVKKTVTLR